MEFTIDDSPATTSHLPPIVKKVMDTLDTLEDGKLVTVYKLAELSGACESTIRGMAQLRANYSVLEYVPSEVGRVEKRLYGNMETIKAWLKKKNTP